MLAIRKLLAAPVIAFMVVGVTTFTRVEAKFPAECELPKAAKGTKERKVDKQCGLPGLADEPEKQAQNRQKNDFCAQGPAVALTREHFEQLQRAAAQAGVRFGSRDHLPTDRGALREILRLPDGTRIGEGSLVRHVGFISHPRYSNVDNGESVNCNFHGEANNDVHFDLLQDTDEEACFSVTAEISPHHRTGHYEVPILRHHRVSERPVRVTGHLFFDASHKPCLDGEPQENLKRISLWEIHPVYSIEVCRRKTMEACRVDNNSAWIPIERFINLAGEEDD